MESATLAETREFVSAMNHFVSGVAVVTTLDGDRPVGATVAAVAPISSDPPMVMVSLSSSSSTAAAIIARGSFAINILGEDEASLAGTFAARGVDKFAGIAPAADALGNPLVPHGVAVISCRVAEVIEEGSHREIRGVAAAVHASGGNPLAYFRGSFAHVQTDADRSLLDALRSHVLELRSDSDHVLDPDALAAAHAASRGEVLRALSRLKSEALVEREDGIYRVSRVSDAVVDAAYEAKLALEIGVASQVIDRLTEADIRVLRAHLDIVQTAAVTAAETDDVDQLVDALDQFGEVFIGLAGSAPLVRAYRSLGLPGIDRRTISRAMLHDVPPAGGFGAVLEGLERHDLEMVLKALRSERRTPAYVRVEARKKEI
jgi:flavin reductase (DIM6/NTAB) family NADH-FMN oxidoreductase RutF/DNA-binding GntR family transcriptional regulator